MNALNTVTPFPDGRTLYATQEDGKYQGEAKEVDSAGRELKFHFKDGIRHGPATMRIQNVVQDLILNWNYVDGVIDGEVTSSFQGVVFSLEYHKGVPNENLKMSLKLMGIGLPEDKYSRNPAISQTIVTITYALLALKNLK